MNSTNINDSGRHRLWGEGSIVINPEHDIATLVPKRESRFHLNALKFLESYCSDCLQITGIKDNGDSTIDLTVKIRHPFAGHPEYTGFDVKGILMFNGSWTHPGVFNFPPYPSDFRVSWRKLGDPQVMNADGYTIRWSPTYDSGSSLPIFNYWQGKFAKGVPDANVNAYLNFYTKETRHIFETSKSDTRTYKIWLPKGTALTAGYAVEACWEPPAKTPVTNPEIDFPTSANQEEAYQFYFNVNNGQPITDPKCCGHNFDPSTAFMFSRQWGGHTAPMFAFYSDHDHDNGTWWYACGDSWPDEYCGNVLDASLFPNGDFIGVAINFRGDVYPPWSYEVAYSVFEFTIDL